MSTFIRQKTNKIEWAEWSWNPVTGCKNDCKYCYAREIASMMPRSIYPKGFIPDFHERQLQAPYNTTIPAKEKHLPGIHNVFLCSMGDLFGPGVKQEWIDKIIFPELE